MIGEPRFSATEYFLNSMTFFLDFCEILNISKPKGSLELTYFEVPPGK